MENHKYLFFDDIIKSDEREVSYIFNSYDKTFESKCRFYYRFFADGSFDDQHKIDKILLKKINKWSESVSKFCFKHKFTLPYIPSHTTITVITKDGNEIKL